MKKKILSIVLSLALCFGASITAFAADPAASTTNNTQTATAAAAVDHTYEVYQIFTAEVSGNKFADPAFGSAMTDAIKTELAKYVGITYTDASDITAKELVEKIGAYSDNSKEAQAITKIIADNVDKASAIAVATDGTIAAGEGYYLVKDITDISGDEEVYKDHSQLQVVEADKNNVCKIVVTEKRDTLEVKKKVQDVNDSIEVKTDWQDSADYDIGDMVPFQLSATIPADLAEYTEYTYVFHDVESTGLAFDKNTVKVYVDNANTPVDSKFYEVRTGANITDNSGDSFQIEMDLKKIPAGKTVYVEYESKLTNGAKIGATGNPNKVRVEFKNDKGGEGKTPWDVVIVFTLKTTINKVDKELKSLAGADFKLEKLAATVDADGKYVVTQKADPNDATKMIDKVIETKTITTNTEGTSFSATGLDDGVYKITETATPAGFNSIDPIYFVVKATHTDGDSPELKSIEVVDFNGKTMVSNAVTGNLGEFVVDKTAGSLDTTIINQEGAVLPSTGGIGTTIFYIVGGVLVVGAVVLLIVRRKMGTSEEE
ncbi:MAG: isopeptide-forming domain-containing fimbrial protein [Lachnospiraceae bacterium]|nr:isopeptide-forming domain-containing fimbrial protein [Lachnospiraceae bacterium]